MQIKLLPNGNVVKRKLSVVNPVHLPKPITINEWGLEHSVVATAGRDQINKVNNFKTPKLYTMQDFESMIKDTFNHCTE